MVVGLVCLQWRPPLSTSLSSEVNMVGLVGFLSPSLILILECGIGRSSGLNPLL